MTGLVVAYAAGVASGVWLLLLVLVAGDARRYGRVSRSGPRRHARRVMFRSSRGRLGR